MAKHSLLKKAMWPRGLVAICALALLAIVGLEALQPEPSSHTNNDAQDAVSQATFSVVSDSDYTESFWATSVAIKQTLPTPSPVPNWPADKQSYFSGPDTAGRASLTALAIDAPPPDYYPPTAIPSNWPTVAEPIYPAGDGEIYDDGWDPIFSKQMRIANKWWATTGEQIPFVYAGARDIREQPVQGQLIVLMIDTIEKASVGNPETYLTPARNGIVRVIDAVGERLTLRASDGTQYYFDVPTRQWVTP